MALKVLKFVTTCVQGYSIEILDTGYTTGDREVTEHTHVQDKSTYDKAINIITIRLKYFYFGHVLDLLRSKHCKIVLPSNQ